MDLAWRAQRQSKSDSVDANQTRWEFDIRVRYSQVKMVPWKIVLQFYNVLRLLATYTENDTDCFLFLFLFFVCFQTYSGK